MLTVDRLVDGINGEDPGGARLYMSQLRENEVRFPDSSIQKMRFPCVDAARLWCALHCCTAAAAPCLGFPIIPAKYSAVAKSLHDFVSWRGCCCRCVEEQLRLT